MLGAGKLRKTKKSYRPCQKHLRKNGGREKKKPRYPQAIS